MSEGKHLAIRLRDVALSLHLASGATSAPDRCQALDRLDLEVPKLADALAAFVAADAEETHE
jgi:hypothetical protein